MTAFFVLILCAAPLFGAGRGDVSGEASGAEAVSGVPLVYDNAPPADSVWTRRAESRFSFDITRLIFILAFILSGLLLYILIRGIAGVAAESVALKQDAAALAAGELMPEEKKKRMVQVKKGVSGLRVKLSAFAIVMVLAVDVMASVPLYLLMTRNQKEMLIQGLWDRAVVMLEGLAANARVFLSMGDIPHMNVIPSQMVSVPEALYVTITGYDPETLKFGDEVWATNDPNIFRKIDTPELRPGRSRITDAISPQLMKLAEELNAQAVERLSGMPRRIIDLNNEARLLSEDTEGVEGPDAEVIRLRLEEDQITIRIFEDRINEVLTRLGSGINSVPEYSPENFTVSENGRYLFFKPVMLRLGGEDSFVWGFVRVEVSVNAILDKVAEEQRTILRINLIIALAALIIGITVAFILSAIIIRPLRQLVKHVETIRDTEDKTKLSGMDINLKSRDEITILGDTVNEMTRGLVNAAFAASDLSVGKEIQKKFLPLSLDNTGDKLSSGFEETMFLDLFGYYEGAKGVSGDYFNYLDLDGRYYAIIKCDVAGKGIPASFIMIQVATMFLNYFKKWKPTEEGMRIEFLVYEINEFIENLAFRDRFAAFTLCLYDSFSGKTRFCNAGDNIIHFYDASEKKLKALTLPETPAAGVLSNIMVESKGGYRVQTITLDHGDILLLFTDGIEESKRKFRSADFEEMVCGEGPANTPHGSHAAGHFSEDLGYARVEQIVNAVMNKQVYTLKKWHNPEGDDKELLFDFRSAKGSVEEVIMAMVAVEKMFRCYYDPRATEDDCVLVDKTLDAFLRMYFLQYRNYCSFTRENPANSAYMYYTHVMEDEQYDDLTILGIKRK